jgi:HEAT repeat protein
VARRLSLDDRLAAIQAIRRQPPSAEIAAAVQHALRDRSNLIVAAAAVVAGEQNLRSFAAELTQAFQRFLVNPEKDDKLCRAKIAIIQALDRVEHMDPEVFYKAARHVQFEPVWNGRVDSAAPLRSAALVAIARIGGSSDLPLLVDSLADPEREVRITAAQTLGSFGTEAAGLVLRLKSRIGDTDPDVLSECLSGLLSVDAHANLPLVCESLDLENPVRCEAGILALGRSRLPDAFDPLKSCWSRCSDAGLRDQISLAISMLRQPAAIEYLISLVGTERPQVAASALAALRIHAHDPRLRERVGAVVKERAIRGLSEQFERQFSVES